MNTNTDYDITISDVMRIAINVKKHKNDVEALQTK